ACTRRLWSGQGVDQGLQAAHPFGIQSCGSPCLCRLGDRPPRNIGLWLRRGRRLPRAEESFKLLLRDTPSGAPASLGGGVNRKQLAALNPGPNFVFADAELLGSLGHG